ncbi:MAG: hypothetical protein JXR03_06840 [Cyclobacteriaceae bacterium]
MYVAVGDEYVKEAENSAKSLIKVDPNASICLISNQPYLGVVFTNSLEVSFPVDPENAKLGYLFKIIGMLETPFERTIFVDTDTYFCDNCEELFGILEFFDLLICHDFQETSFAQIDGVDLAGYHTYNTGVIAFNSSPQVIQLIKNWRDVFQRKMDSYWSDQPAFMDALLSNFVKVYVMQTHYNFRFRQFLTISDGNIKILHGRYPNMIELEKTLNKVEGYRAWDPKAWKLRNWSRKSWFEKLKEIVSIIRLS